VATLRDSLVAFTGVSREQHPESFDGVLVVTDSTITTGKVDYLGTNTSSFESMGQLEGNHLEGPSSRRAWHGPDSIPPLSPPPSSPLTSTPPR